METVITKFDNKFRKAEVAQVRSGDTVRVHQKIIEGGKERTQVFEGMVIRRRRQASTTANITVRRVASGVGVEKTFFLHSPTITKVDIVKRTKVRRNFLSYMRERTGKSTRLTEQEFDREAVNVREEASTEEQAASNKKQEPTSEEEKPTKKELQAEKAAEEESKPVQSKSTKDKKVANKAEVKKEEPEPKEDKAAEKKAKAEAFRKAQAAKK